MSFNTFKVLALMASVLWLGVTSCSNSNPMSGNTPSLYTPANKIVIDSLAITFNWGAINNAALYEFQLSNDKKFADPIVDDSVLLNTYSIAKTNSPLTTNTTYYWRVRAITSSSPGAWSGERSFSTYISKPQSVSTEGNYSLYSYNIALTPTLTWQPV